MSDADVFVADERGRRERPFLFPWVRSFRRRPFTLVADIQLLRTEGCDTFKVYRSEISTLNLHPTAFGEKRLRTTMCHTVSNLPPNGSLRASPKPYSILARTVILHHRARGRQTRQRKLAQATRRRPKLNHNLAWVS